MWHVYVACLHRRRASLSPPQIASHGVTDAFVARWKRRFVEGGVLALGDLPRSGRPDWLDPKVEARILARTREAPPATFTHWSAPINLIHDATRAYTEYSALKAKALGGLARPWAPIGRLLKGQTRA